MTGLILLILFLFAIVYLLVAPLYVEINSDDGLYSVRFHRLARARLRMIDSSLMVDLSIVGWQRHIDLFAPRKKKKETNKNNTARQKEKKGMPFKKIRAIMQTFSIVKCDLSVDSGNMPLNGILYPLFEWASFRTGKNMRINFRDENKIVLRIKNNFARIIWAFITSSFITIKNKAS